MTEPLTVTERFTKIVHELASELEEAEKEVAECKLKLLLANFPTQQATNCGRCDAYKHTPWRDDEYGYICVGCLNDIWTERVAVMHSRIEPASHFIVTQKGRQGMCLSFFDHFEVYWNDGTILRTLELSFEGISKVKEEPPESDIEPLLDAIELERGELKREVNRLQEALDAAASRFRNMCKDCSVVQLLETQVDAVVADRNKLQAALVDITTEVTTVWMGTNCTKAQKMVLDRCTDLAMAGLLQPIEEDTTPPTPVADATIALEHDQSLGPA